MARERLVLVRQMLDVLNHSIVDYAFLHGAEQVDDGHVSSDLDLVANKSGRKVVGLLRAGLPPHIHLFMEYEGYQGGDVSYWWDTTTGGVVQLDVLYDPKGRGPYGLLTGSLFPASRTQAGTPRVSEQQEQLYLAIKGLRKGDLARAEQARRRLLTPGSPIATSHVLRTDMAAAIDIYMATGQRISLPPARRAQEYLRIITRVVSMPGLVLVNDVVPARRNAGIIEFLRSKGLRAHDLPKSKFQVFRMVARSNVLVASASQAESVRLLRFGGVRIEPASQWLPPLKGFVL